MGFLKQDAPVVDYEEWSKGTRAEKIVPMARHWAEVGFGTPVVLHLFYVVKILLYVLAAWLIVLTTKGIDGFTTSAQWYAEPIVFQKVVLYTMLFEVVGLGCGFGPLNNRFFPPMGSILYWLRPKTIRLPPWPNRIPLTKGDARTPFDVALYAALLVMLVIALFSDGTGPIPELDTGRRAADVADLDDPRPPRRARAARQGDLPGRPRRGVRLAGGRVPVRRCAT